MTVVGPKAAAAIAQSFRKIGRILL